jgi:hypothetical protein
MLRVVMLTWLVAVALRPLGRRSPRAPADDVVVKEH